MKCNTVKRHEDLIEALAARTPAHHLIRYEEFRENPKMRSVLAVKDKMGRFIDDTCVDHRSLYTCTEVAALAREVVDYTKFIAGKSKQSVGKSKKCSLKLLWSWGRAR